MAVAGSLIYDTEIDKNGFEKGINSLKASTNSAFSEIKNIVTALGINKLISATFNTLTNSISSAISRLDTLNNYTKVMQNLGASAQDADKSLDTLSDGLDGLPTALNDAATSVQRLMASNGDINKATRYYLAMNDALLAGGTAANTQSAAMEQFLQMYSKGTVASQEWTSVLTAMPAQLQQVATSFGYTSTAVSGDFYTALQNGEISMEEFMDRLVLLDTKGTESITSFSQQAKDATGGIETAMTNLQTRITKGVADIIESFDTWLQSERFGSIAEILDNVGIKAKEVLSGIAEKLPILLDKLVEVIPYIKGVGVAFLSWKIGTTLQSFVQGFQKAQVTLALFKLRSERASIAQGLFNGTLTLGETIVGLLTGKVKLAELATAALSKAQSTLNAVMSANPIALVVLAIGALIAIFVVLWNKCEWFRNFWIGLWEGIKSVFEAVWSALKTFFTEIIPNAFQTLLDKLSEIGNNIKNFFEKLWSSVVSFFTETIPNAFQTLLNKITKIGNDIKSFFQNLWNNAISFFTQTIPQWIQSVINWFKQLPYQIGYQIGQILGLFIQFKIDVWNWITIELPQIIQGIIDCFAQLPGRIYEYLVNVYNNIVQWVTNVYNSINQWVLDIYTIVTQWVSDTINSIVTFFSELPGKLQEWLTNTINNVIEWVINIYVSVKSWIEKTINSVVDWFKSLPDKIQSWLQKVINNVVNWGKDMASRGKKAAEDLFNNVIDTIEELPGKMLNIGKNIVEGLWNGIKNAGNWIKGKVGEFAQGIFDGMKNALGIHSPSTLFRDGIGRFIPQGVAVGIEADTDSALRAIDNMNDGIMQEMNRAVLFETGSINASASVKSNNSMLNVIKATFNIDGSVDIDGQKAGRIMTPYMTKTLRAGGVC